MRKRIIIILSFTMLLLLDSSILLRTEIVEKLAVSLVIDTSGSLKKTDPQKLRETAAHLFIDLLGDDDYLGIITFSDTAEVVIPIEELSNDAKRQSHKAILESKLEAKGGTDYTAAFHKSIQELSKVDAPNTRKVLVFLTDGEPSPSGIVKDPQRMKSYMEDFWITAVDPFVNLDIPVYSIGFSSGVDQSVLETIAKKTGGDNRVYVDSAELNDKLIKFLNTREVLESEFLTPKPQENPNLKPVIMTDFLDSIPILRLGEEILISASLQFDGHKISNGLNLQLDSFQLVIEYSDGSNITLPLYDDGTLEHLDILPNDGIWSNKFSFSRNDLSKMTLSAKGDYRDKKIDIEKDLKLVTIVDNEQINVSIQDADFWQLPGKTLIVPLKIENLSSFTETIIVLVDGNMVELGNAEINVQPHTSISHNLELILNDDIEKGSYSVTLNLKTDNDLTPFNQDRHTVKFGTGSRIESWFRLKFSYQKLIILFTLILSLLGLMIYVTGQLLFVFLVKPQRKVTGKLLISPKNNPNLVKDYDLSKFDKNKLEISFDETKAADIHLIGSKYGYSLIIEVVLRKYKYRFLAGWHFLMNRSLDRAQLVSSTRPGIIEEKGSIQTRIILSTDDTFDSGEYHFHFIQTDSRFTEDESRAIDILEGRV